MIILQPRTGEGIVKERFKDIVEEIGIAFRFPSNEMGKVRSIREQMPDESLVATAPWLAPLHAKPPLLLQEVEEDDLAEKLLGKVIGFDAAFGKVVFNSRIVCEIFFERVAGLFKQDPVMIIELLGDLLNTKRGLQRGNRWVSDISREQFDKLLLCGVAILVFADKVTRTAGGREQPAFSDEAEFRLFKCEVQFDE